MKLERIRKVYENGFVAVHDATFVVQDGEFVVLVGPSGCGKSTTLRMIAGLESITGGRLWIGDRLVNGVPAKERDIAMVFQNYALYPHMTAYENMAFALKLRNVARAEIDRRVREAAALLAIEEILDRKPRQLSGGQRQRVAVGRAIVRQPSVFLFDEPLSNLDAKLRVQTRKEISALHRRLGATMIYVTHDQVEAMTMGDRIVVMEAGRVRQIGTPAELYERPANAFVASFIGTPSMNLWRGRLIEDGGAVLFVGRGGGPRIPIEPHIVARVDRGGEGELLLGVRPEDLALADGGPPPPCAATLEARVEFIEPLGHEAILHATAAGAAVVCRVAPRPLPPREAPIRLSIDLRRLHLFDAATGERLGGGGA